MKKHIFCLVALACGSVTWADGTINIASPTSGEGYTFANNIVTISADGNYTVTDTSTTNRILIAAGVTATVTLQNVNITSAVASPFALSPDGCDVTVRLVGTNTLTATMTNSSVSGTVYGAGIQVEGSSKVTIEGSGRDFPNNEGEGSLTATGSANGAGIGSAYVEDEPVHATGTIIINGGNIIATASWGAAGIGGGSYSSSGNITINGGNITAVAGYQSAAIGGGAEGDGSNININGGNILAIAYGGMYDPPAIGGGAHCYPGDINISDGRIFAWGKNGPGIGNASNVSGGNIYISGGTIITDEIGIGAGSGRTTTSVSAGFILVNSINTTTFGNATVTTNAALTDSIVLALAATTVPQPLTDTAYLHDTTHIDTTIHDTTEIFRHDTLTRIRRDTVHSDNTLNLYYHDTINAAIYDTIEVIRFLETHDTTQIPTIVPGWTDTIYMYTIEIHDTLYLPGAGSHDTLYLLHDTLIAHEVRYIREYLHIADTATLHDTLLIYDTLLIEGQVYVTITRPGATGAQHIVEPDTHVSNYGADGIRIAELYGLEPLVIYNLEGKIIVSAYPTGQVYTRDPFPHGTFLLYSNNRWTRFAH